MTGEDDIGCNCCQWNRHVTDDEKEGDDEKERRTIGLGMDDRHVSISIIPVV
jgi:hypothetical protein